jgi:hypothetical protein
MVQQIPFDIVNRSKGLEDLSNMKNSGYGPFNIRVMDVDDFVQKNIIAAVTSFDVLEPSTTLFHKDGLFSEEIFGAVGSDDRMKKFGFLPLSSNIIAPIIYKNLIKISSLYDDILAGRVYATFNSEIKNFERVVGDPEDVEDAGTGYAFFLSHYHEIEFPLTESLKRENRVTLLNQYREVSLINKYIVLPAGFRDIRIESGARMVQDEINKLYRSMISLSLSIPEKTVNPIYNQVRYKLQEKAIEVYDYLENFQTGKRGFMQNGGYGSRSVAFGTRNVLSAASYVMDSPDDPRSLKPDEVMVGLYQSCKGMEPFVIHHLKTAFFTPILGESDEVNVPLTDPKTLNLVYTEISQLEKDKFVTRTGINKWLTRFSNEDVRRSAVTIYNRDKKPFYLCLVYDQGDRISIVRSLGDLEKNLGKKVDRTKLRPITWAEIVYLATYIATFNKYAMVTRYPAIEDGSCYPAKIHLNSTSNSRTVKLYDLITGEDDAEYPHYPSLDANDGFLDSTIVHTSALGGLGAD